MVDEGNKLRATYFLRDQSTAEIWKFLRLIWCLTYLGLPDYLVVDQEYDYVSGEIQSRLEEDGVKLRQNP